MSLPQVAPGTVHVSLNSNCKHAAELLTFAVSCPRAAAASRRRLRAAAAAARKLGDKALTKAADTLLKRPLVASLPVGAVGARLGLVTSKGNVEDVVGAVAVVASDAFVGEADLAEGDGSLASSGAAVGITPDTVVLRDTSR